MWLIDQIAERKIRQAMERGDLDDLPGAGRALELGDDPLIPGHLRAGYRLLRNAGYLPHEVLVLRGIRDAETLLARVTDPDERTRLVRRLLLLETRLAEGRGRGLPLAMRSQYRDQLVEALGDRDPSGDGGGEGPSAGGVAILRRVGRHQPPALAGSRVTRSRTPSA